MYMFDPERIYDLYFLIICDSKSLPPVDALDFKIIAEPMPTKIPP